MELIAHLLFIVSTLVIGANGGFIFSDYLNKREKKKEEKTKYFCFCYCHYNFTFGYYYASYK